METENLLLLETLDVLLLAENIFFLARNLLKNHQLIFQAMN
jgi:hypothetical protein